MKRIPVIGLIVLTLALPIPVMAQDATPAASPSAASGDFAGLVDIGGRKIYLECHGTGSPTVVLVAGGRTSARYWTDDLLHPDAPRTMVMPGVAQFTRVCAYDRPGTYALIGDDVLPSRSDPVAQPRTVEVGARSAAARSTSHSGKRRSTSSSTTRPSIRASAAPRQKWRP